MISIKSSTKSTWVLVFCAIIYNFLITSALDDRADLRTEIQRFDGWYNNLAHPSWGSIGKTHHPPPPTTTTTTS